MAAQTKLQAKGVIDKIDTEKLVKKALEKKTLSPWDVDAAAADYKQFLFLLWVNHTMSGKEPVVPTERADALWHEHILFTHEYHQLGNDLIGKYIHHMPGLEKGSKPFNRAVEHTRTVHREHGYDGFAPMYLAGCSASPTHVPAATPAKSSDAGHGDGGGSSCGGSSCGGSGCGSGCGGGCGG